MNRYNFEKPQRTIIAFVIGLGEKLQNESKEFESRLNFNKGEAIDHYTKELDNEDAIIIVAEKIIELSAINTIS